MKNINLFNFAMSTFYSQIASWQKKLIIEGDTGLVDMFSID